MREETLAIVRRMQDNEATDQRVYAALAKQASLQKNSEILEKMSHDEGLHCAVWGRYTGIEAKADMFRVWLFVVLGKIFGLVFVINLMEGGEDDSAENYRKLMEELPEARSIMEDETRHEAQLAAMIHEEKLSYISSMVLGLNDALVELTGALAGFTLALNDNRMVGMAGFITGVAATLSMAAENGDVGKAPAQGGGVYRRGLHDHRGVPAAALHRVREPTGGSGILSVRRGTDHFGLYLFRVRGAEGIVRARFH